MKTLLACIDTSPYAESVVDHAAWAAGPLGAAVELLRVAGAPPVVFGRIEVPGATQTLALYAHYDGQPANPDEWQRYLAADDAVRAKRQGFFVGQVMKATKGQADGKIVTALLEQRRVGAD